MRKSANEWGTTVTDASAAREHGELVARAVKAFGFNTTLAPVLDLGLPESAEVMGTRAAAATAAEVVRVCAGVSGGLAAQGVAGCGKHFPGLGGGTLGLASGDAGDRAHVEARCGMRTWRRIANCVLGCRW